MSESRLAGVENGGPSVGTGAVSATVADPDSGLGPEPLRPAAEPPFDVLLLCTGAGTANGEDEEPLAPLAPADPGPACEPVLASGARCVYSDWCCCCWCWGLNWPGSAEAGSGAPAAGVPESLNTDGAM